METKRIIRLHVWSFLQKVFKSQGTFFTFEYILEKYIHILETKTHPSDDNHNKVTFKRWRLALISKPSQLKHTIELCLTLPHRPVGIEGLRLTSGPASIKVLVALQLIKRLTGGVVR